MSHLVAHVVRVLVDHMLLPFDDLKLSSLCRSGPTSYSLIRPHSYRRRVRLGNWNDAGVTAIGGILSGHTWDILWILVLFCCLDMPKSHKEP